MRPMSALDVRTWIAEIKERDELADQFRTMCRVIDMYRAVLQSIAENPINPSPTRATAEEALTI